MACCGVSLGAVLRRPAARCAAWRCVGVHCVVSFCSVWCCRAPCCVLGRRPLSWGPVPSGAVLCLVPPRCVCFAVVCRCVVLFAVVLCAVYALGCPVVRTLSSTPHAVLLCGPLSLGALFHCAVPRGAVLPRGAMVSCPAALLGLFLAWVWLYLLGKPLQNFVKYFFLLFLAFECMQIITRGKAERSQADVPPDCLLHDVMSQDHSEKKVQTGATFERLLRKLADKANHIRERHQLQENSPVIIMHAVAFPEPRNPHSDQRTSASMQGPPFAVHLYWRKETLARLKSARPVDQSFNEEIRQVVAARQDGDTPHENPQERDPEQNTT